MTKMQSFGMCVLVMLMGHYCGALAARCSGEVFAGNTHVCCFNTLHEKPATWDEARCCIQQPYNPATHFCCWVTINIARVTPKESWSELGRRSCYNGPI